MFIWSEQYGNFGLALRESQSLPDKLEVVLISGRKEMVLRMLTATGNETITIQSFADVLGWTGFRLTEQQGRQEQSWNVRTYYGVENDTAREIAVSFGWGAPQDYLVDLNRDGQTELVSNVVYGGDGHESAIIYQRRGSQVWQGRHNVKGLPDYDDRGVNSTAVVYDPLRNSFLIRYMRKGEMEPGMLETTGFEMVEFFPRSL